MAPLAIRRFASRLIRIIAYCLPVSDEPAVLPVDSFELERSVLSVVSPPLVPESEAVPDVL